MIARRRPALEAAPARRVPRPASKEAAHLVGAGGGPTRAPAWRARRRRRRLRKGARGAGQGEAAHSGRLRPGAGSAPRSASCAGRAASAPRRRRSGSGDGARRARRASSPASRPTRKSSPAGVRPSPHPISLSRCRVACSRSRRRHASASPAAAAAACASRKLAPMRRRCARRRPALCNCASMRTRQERVGPGRAPDGGVAPAQLGTRGARLACGSVEALADVEQRPEIVRGAGGKTQRRRTVATGRRAKRQQHASARDVARLREDAVHAAGEWRARHEWADRLDSQHNRRCARGLRRGDDASAPARKTSRTTDGAEGGAWPWLRSRAMVEGQKATLAHGLVPVKEPSGANGHALA